MKILVIAGWYRTGKSPYSGLFFAEQAKALRRFGHELVMIVPGVLGLRDTFDGSAWVYRKKMEDGIPVLYFRIPGLMLHRIPAFFDFIWRHTTRYLYRIVLREYGAPDIIHAHHSLTAGMQALRLRSPTGSPRVVVTEHSSLFLEGSLKKADAKRIGTVIEQADRFICVSDGLRDNIEHLLGRGSARLITIPNMVSNVFFEVPIKLKKQKAGKYTFVSCGNFVSVKGYEFLIESFARAVNRGMEARLVLIGSGPLGSRLVSLVRQLDVADLVDFTGALEAREVARYLADCDCFCSTSLMETFGIVMCEALACGLPLLATDTAGARSIVHEGINGHLVRGRNQDEFGKWMLRHARMEFAYDPATLREEAHSRFSEKSVVGSITSVYEDCMAKRSDPGMRHVSQESKTS
jgi:glycosyltransferase involved in cell wall biosynthesis